ncbi:MAG: tetratricopeptide repeat protein, partial [Myxococcota bacterium]
VAMCLSSIAIDVSIGGRFKVAKTLANIGMTYARLGDVGRGLAYLERARSAHARYEDRDARIDTTLVMATILLEMDECERARELVEEAAKLTAVVGNVYDRIHQLAVEALLSHRDEDHYLAADYAARARQLAESQGLVSYHVFATSVEAAARVASGEVQAGVLLATTALGAVEAMEGSEYGTKVRWLCCQAVSLAVAGDRLDANPSVWADVVRRSVNHIDRIAGYIRDPGHRERFFARAPVRFILEQSTKLRSHDSRAPGLA